MLSSLRLNPFALFTMYPAKQQPLYFSLILHCRDVSHYQPEYLIAVTRVSQLLADSATQKHSPLTYFLLQTYACRRLKVSSAVPRSVVDVAVTACTDLVSVLLYVGRAR